MILKEDIPHSGKHLLGFQKRTHLSRARIFSTFKQKTRETALSTILSTLSTGKYPQKK